MDIYKKRKMKKEQNVNKQEDNSKMNINWVKVIYENTVKTLYISSF